MSTKKLVRNRCANRSNVIGSAVVTLDGTVDGRRPIESIFDPGDTVRYIVEEPGEDPAWEQIEGVLVAGSPPHITRVKTLDSSSPSGDAIAFSAAPGKLVFVDADDALIGAERGRLNIAVSTGALSGGNCIAYELDIPVPPQQLKDGVEVWFFVHAPNGDPGAGNFNTLKVNDTDAKPIKAGNPRRRIAFGAMTTDALVGCKFNEAGDCWVPIGGLVKVTKTVAGAAYTAVEEDNGQELLFTNAGGCAVTLPQATVQFAAPFSFEYQALGGALTFTPTTSTINGAASAKIGGRNAIAADAGNYRASLMGREAIAMPITSLAVAVTTGTGKKKLPMPYAFVATEVIGWLNTPQASGSIFTVDINNGATSILSTKLTIDNTEASSLTAATPPVISNPVFAKGDVMNWDVDQIGNGSAAGCVCEVIGYQLP